jgi:hypothetical protein
MGGATHTSYKPYAATANRGHQAPSEKHVSGLPTPTGMIVLLNAVHGWLWAYFLLQARAVELGTGLCRQRSRRASSALRRAPVGSASLSATASLDGLATSREGRPAAFPAPQSGLPVIPPRRGFDQAGVARVCPRGPVAGGVPLEAVASGPGRPPPRGGRGRLEKAREWVGPCSEPSGVRRLGQRTLPCRVPAVAVAEPPEVQT